MRKLYYNLYDRHWKFFKLSDLLVSEDKLTRVQNISLLSKGPTIVVGRSKYLNAYKGRYDIKASVKGSCITIPLVGSLKAFWQDEDFALTSGIKVLRSDKLNKYSGLFFVTVINYNLQSSGVDYHITPNFVDSMSLSLPVDYEGNPDYIFMENYMKQFERNYSDYSGSVISSQISLRGRSFKDFKVGDVFKVSKTTCEEIPKELAKISGVPYLTSALENNGVCMYVNKEDEPSELYKGNCITVSVFPKKKSSFYQDSDFYAGGGAGLNILRNENLNKFNSLFIIACLDSEIVPRVVKGKRMTLDRLFDLVISLPVTASGEIDWQFMEDYIKSRPLSRCVDLLSK